MKDAVDRRAKEPADWRTMSTTVSNGPGPANGTPGPRGNPVLGSMRDFQRDKLGFIRGLTRYGDVARYRMAHLTWYQINHPDGIRRVLQENNRNYGKGAPPSL